MLKILQIIMYIILMVIVLCIYQFRNKIIEFILLPSPMISYYFINWLPIKNELLKTLVKLRYEVEKQFNNIDLVPIILCIDYKPFDVNIHTFCNLYLAYTITSKTVILHVNSEYYINVINILESIWNGKPFHAIVVHSSMYDRRVMQSMNTLNIISKLSQINAPLYIYFDMNDKENSLATMKNCMQYEIINNSITALYDSFEIFMQQYLHELLNDENNNIKNWCDNIAYLQNNKKSIIEYIYSLSNCNFTLKSVFLYSSLNTNKTELLYTFDNIINSECSYTKYNKHHINNRINKVIISIITIIVTICGYYTFINFTRHTVLYNNAYEIRNILKNTNNTLSNEKIDVNLSPYSDGVLTTKPTKLTQLLLPQESFNIKKLRQYTLNNIQEHFNSNSEFYMEKINFNNHPTQIINFTKLKNTTKNCINTYNIIYKIHQKQYIKNFDFYTQSLQNNIIKIFNEWLESLRLFILIEKKATLLNTMNAVYKNNSTLQDYKAFLQQCNEMKNLFAYTNNDWWINNNLGDNFDNLMNTVKNIPIIGKELYNTLINQKNIFLASIKNDFLYNTHELINNNNIFIIYENDNKFTINFSEAMNSFIFNINNLLQDELICLSAPTFIMPKLDENTYFIWNNATVQKIISYKSKYFALLNKLNVYNNTIIQSITNICNEKLYEHIYSSLIYNSTTVSTQYSINKIANNINTNYLFLKEIIQFVNINLNQNISYINDINKHNLNIIYNQIKNVVRKSILSNYQFLNDWNGDNDITQILFAKPAAQLPDLVENMILQLKGINSDVIEYILNSAYELTTYEFKYFQYLNNTMKGYENGTRNDLGRAKEFLLSLLNLNLTSQAIQPTDIDTTHDIAFYTQIFKTAVQSRINEIVLNKSKILFNKLVQFYNKKLKDYAPFNVNGSPAQINHIIEFINMYQTIRPHLIADTELFKRYLTIENDMKFLDTLCNFFIIDNNNISVNVIIEDYNEYYSNVCSNTNLILNYIHKFGNITYKDPLSVNHKYNINDNYTFILQIVNSSEMEIATYASDAHVTTKNNKLQVTYNNQYGLFNFISKLNIERSGVDKENVILRVPVKIISFDNINKTSDEDLIITYLRVQNWPNIHNHILTKL